MERRHVLAQQPGIPGLVISDFTGTPKLAISKFSEVHLRDHQRSFAEVLAPPTTPGGPWELRAKVEHQGMGWRWWKVEDLHGASLGDGDCPNGPSTAAEVDGATIRSGATTWVLRDLIRPESDEERGARERKRFFRRERRDGRVLGLTLHDSTETEVGRLIWVGDAPPDHHDRPYRWQFTWAGDADLAVLVGAAGCALRFMAHAGTMLVT